MVKYKREMHIERFNKIELKSLDKDDYGKYKYFPYEYAQQLLKLGKKLQLDEQQKKANKLYGKENMKQETKPLDKMSK